MRIFLPGAPPAELVINRIHCLPKPTHLPETTARDTIIRIHFFHIKERLMWATRNSAEYPHPYTKLSFYADLSQYTMLKHKNLSTITKPLRNHQITYKWGHSVKLVITREDKSFTIRPVEEGLSILRQWGSLEPREYNNNVTAPTGMTTGITLIPLMKWPPEIFTLHQITYLALSKSLKYGPNVTSPPVNSCGIHCSRRVLLLY